MMGMRVWCKDHPKRRSGLRRGRLVDMACHLTPCGLAAMMADVMSDCVLSSSCL
jgi:hypothetical protein